MVCGTINKSMWSVPWIRVRDLQLEAQSWAGYGVPRSQWGHWIGGSHAGFRAEKMGPAVLLALVIGGLLCFLISLCFAEVGGAFEVRVGRICTPERRSVILWVLKSVG